ncbi:DNase I-like protein, partial [Lentinus brumalis]
RKKRTRAHLTVGSLNMRGYGEARSDQASEKWLCINQVVRDGKIAILALQETHLTNERIDNLNQLFDATLLIHGSCDLNNPTGARGVAFAINKRLINVDEISFREEEPGRALEMNMKWTNGQTLKILNVYAPNDMTENCAFWSRRTYSYGTPAGRKLDIVMGDFNVVTDPIDRLPPHRDLLAAQESVEDFMRKVDLVDGWRERNPSKRQYTYMQQATGSQSRIDRIYVRRTLMSKANNWNMDGPGFRTDHRMVTVGLSNTSTPYQGKGRWALPSTLLTDKIFLKQMRELGMSMQAELDNQGERSEMANPQRTYASFKQKLVDAARKRARCCIPQLDRQIEAIKTDIDRACNGTGATQDRIDSLAILQERLTELEARRFGAKRRAVAANDWAMGETICKYWTRLN